MKFRRTNQTDPAYPLDGTDLLTARIAGVPPALSAKREPSDLRALTSDRSFFWRNSNQSAVLKGRWKYLHDGANEYLFNLEVDERERANFRTQNPAMFEQLKKEFADWEKSVLPCPPARVRQL